MTTSAPSDPYVQLGAEHLGTLEENERLMASRMSGNIESVAELAASLAGCAVTTRRLRAHLVTLAEAIAGFKDGNELALPPDRPTIPAIDPDGVLWAALETGDSATVARALGEVAARWIEKDGGQRG
jgi:hypothetical protein